MSTPPVPGGNSTDSFFNDFNTSSSTTGPPPTGSRQPRPPPQPRPMKVRGQQHQQQQQLPNNATKTAPTSTQPRPPSQPPQPNYQSSTSVLPVQYPRSNPVVPQQPQTSSMYYNAQGPTPTLPSQQQVYTNQPIASQDQSSNDWYTPNSLDGSLSGSNNDYGGISHQQHYQQPPIQAGTSSSVPGTTPYNMYSNTTSYFDGPMDTSGRNSNMNSHNYNQPQTFIPQPQQQQSIPQADLHDYYEQEAPLLEELGVNWDHIMMKTKAVVVPFRRFQQNSALMDPSMIVEDADLAGPLAYALLLGGELLVTGKLQFGYIYGFGLFGCLAMTLILNLMSQSSISFWTVTSILGYALIPVNLLAFLKIILFSFGTLVRILALFTVLWSTIASTRLLEIGFGLSDQRYLLAYPIALLYSAFVLITIF